jgi:hypothetical protein
MGEAVKHPEKVYGGLLARPGAMINVESDIHMDIPHLRDLFNRAGRGENVVTNDLTNELIGGKTRLYRGDPDDKTAYDFSADIKPLMELAQLKSQGPLTEDETKQFEEAVKNVSQKTGLTDNYVRISADNFEKALRNDDQGLFASFGINPGDAAGKKLGEEIARRTRNGGLTPGEEAKLQQDLQVYAARNNIGAVDMHNKIILYEDRVRTNDKKKFDGAVSGVNSTAVDTKNGLYAYYPLENGAEDNLEIPKFKMDEINRFKALAFDEKDLPRRVPPFSIEQTEFLFALHESEHGMAMAGRHPVFADGFSPNLKDQALEIDADSAVIKYLSDSGDKYGKEYWLKLRNVQSVADGLSGNYDHDTATFLRVLDKTGKQIDLAQFRQQKEGLVNKIGERIDREKAKTGDIMGAVRDLLKEDKEHPEKNLLTPVQRAEAEQYLDDARELGFRPNSNYPRPPAVPVLQANAASQPSAQGMS